MKQIYLFKRLFASFVLMLMTTFSWAYDFKYKGIYYNVDSYSVKTVAVTDGVSNPYSGSVTIPSSVIYGGNIYTVTSIGDNAFKNCTGLTSVTIPESVTSIGDGAFINCSGLTAINIPNSVTSISDFAFSGCTSLPVIDNVRYADTYLVEAVDKNKSTYRIKEGTRVIGGDAFRNCSALTSVTIPESVTSIGSYAFYGCSSLTSVTIPNSVTDIGINVFIDCPRLTSVTINSSVIFTKSYSLDKSIINIFGEQVKEYIIGNNITSIGAYTFNNCSSLTTITIPNSLTSIGMCAFRACSSLKFINIPNGVTGIGNGAFYNCSSLTSINIPDGVTSIGEKTFFECSSLTSINIPDGVTSIGNSAFYNCPNLKVIAVPNSITSIASEAFSGCSGLTTISIGSGIQTIGNNAFSNCRNINDVYCYAIRYPSTFSNAFVNSYPDYIILHVPDESVDNYKAVAPWSTFKKVVGLSSDSGSEACEKPVLTYKDGKLEATSETEGAQCVIVISDEDVNTHFNSVNLTATYHINAYATKPNYKNSEIVTATLCWIDQEPETEGLINDVAEVRALPVLIQSEGGVISVNGINSGTEVRVYSVNGIMAGSAAATDNSAQINTNLLPGSIAIVKIGEKSVKIVMK